MSSHPIRTLPETSCSLVIVGAGLAGLYAAKLLQGKYPDLLVLEATDQPGGRVRQVPGVAPWPVEAGPQFIHGAHSSLQELLNDIGCNVDEYDWPNNWYFGQGRRFFGADTEDADLKATHNLFAEVGQESYPDEDMSAEQWLRSKGANDKMLAIADACYANDFGCSLQQLGLREMITENRKWDSGDSYLVLDRDLSCLIKHIAKNLHQSVLCNCPVTKVVYDAEGAVVTAAGRQIRAQQVLVTVPITVLQREDVMFVPALPQAKQEAIQRVKMSNAIKVIMLFEQPFWPADFFDVICTDCFIPEFWVTKPPTHPSAPHTKPAQAPASQQQSPAEPSASLESATDRHTDGHNANLAGSQNKQGQGLKQTSEPLPLPQTQDRQHAQTQPLKIQQLQQKQQALQQQTADQRQQQPLHEQTGQQQAAPPQQHSQQQHSQQQSESQQHSQQQQFGQQQQQQLQDQAVVPDVHCMVGFIAGTRAEEMSKMSQTSVIMNTLAQLDTMFGTSKQRHPATFNFVRAHMVDWSQQKHIYGAYTYPTLHAEVGDRDILAEPLCNTVFFAGEATHSAINPCMQAAMETGQRAAKRILALHGSDGSKL